MGLNVSRCLLPHAHGSQTQTTHVELDSCPNTYHTSYTHACEQYPYTVYALYACSLEITIQLKIIAMILI